MIRLQAATGTMRESLLMQAFRRQLVSGGTGIQYAFTGWSSGGTYYASDAITMNGPYTDTAEYVTQFYLTVTGGDGASTGQGWYNTGSDATASSAYVWNFAAGQSRSSLHRVQP